MKRPISGLLIILVDILILSALKRGVIIVSYQLLVHCYIFCFLVLMLGSYLVVSSLLSFLEEKKREKEKSKKERYDQQLVAYRVYQWRKKYNVEGSQERDWYIAESLIRWQKWDE